MVGEAELLMLAMGTPSTVRAREAGQGRELDC
jgi:hypothetical protein